MANGNKMPVSMVTDQWGRMYPAMPDDLLARIEALEALIATNKRDIATLRELVGAPGPRGPEGPAGPRGPQGERGPAGPAAAVDSVARASAAALDARLAVVEANVKIKKP